MEEESYHCAVCEELVSADALQFHIESIHVGPEEEPKIACGECPYKVPKSLTQQMVNHCIKTRHDVNKVAYNWQNEDERLQDILLLSYDMKTGGQPRSLVAVSKSNKEKKKKRSIETPKPKETKTLKLESIQYAEEEVQKKETEEASMEEEVVQSFEDDPIAAEEKHFESNEEEPEQIQEKLSETRSQGIINVTCQNCNKSLRAHGNVDLVRHVTNHLPNSFQPFQCNFCEYKSNRKMNIRKHCKTEHGSPTEYSVELDQSVEASVKQLLVRCLPDITDWDERLKFGIPGIHDTRANAKLRKSD